MLSKVMMPDAAKSYFESISTKSSILLAKTSSPDILKEKISAPDSSQKTNNPPLEKRKINSKKSNCVNSNWEKYKEIMSQTGTGAKSPPKRHLNSTESPRKGKRMSRDNSTSNLALNAECILNAENTSITKHIAIDCEMVGIGDGSESMLARVSIVNRYGACIYDKYVKPREIVQDYRTAVSGIRPHHLQNGEEFDVVQGEVAELLWGRVLVGHALKNDLSVLFLSHPKRFQRDTSRYSVFRRVSKGNTPSLKKLAAELLGVNIQTGEHNSIEDARATMQLYILYENRWESDIRNYR